MQGQNGITFFTPNITLSSGHFFNKDQLYLSIFSSHYKRCVVKDNERVKKSTIVPLVCKTDAHKFLL